MVRIGGCVPMASTAWLHVGAAALLDVSAKQALVQRCPQASLVAKLQQHPHLPGLHVWVIEVGPGTAALATSPHALGHVHGKGAQTIITGHRLPPVGSFMNGVQHVGVGLHHVGVAQAAAEGRLHEGSSEPVLTAHHARQHHTFHRNNAPSPHSFVHLAVRALAHELHELHCVCAAVVVSTLTTIGNAALHRMKALCVDLPSQLVDQAAEMVHGVPLAAALLPTALVPSCLQLWAGLCGYCLLGQLLLLQDILWPDALVLDSRLRVM
mmetsp:Transcript_7904/g.16948  ORF Transcript_7904/g.16948 Transcript_7904/m.16948 type:complete len:267 (-) Transcript_7904:945-1745(-)